MGLHRRRQRSAGADPLITRFALLGLLATVGCAGTRPGVVGARGYHYSDNSGLKVLTTAATLDQPVRRDVTVLAHALVDRIDVQRTVLDPGDPGALAQLTGHADGHADAVTSASTIAGGGGVAQKWRFEGMLGALWAPTVGERPVTLRVAGRASTETDYRSLSGQLAGSVELFDRHTTVSAFAGGGHDWVDPIEDPPGYQDVWPARHHRLTWGTSIAQLLTGRLVARAGGGMTFQAGALSNPYRRALVLAPGGVSGTLYPEVLPRHRRRTTGFLGLSWYVGRGLALHAQQGGYTDSWGVRAFIPEVSLAKELADGTGRQALVLLRYRHYRQTAARFHEAHYSSLNVQYLSGDPRLGALTDHTAGVELRWAPWPGSGLTAALGYDFSRLVHRDGHNDTAVRAHVPMLSIAHAGR